MTVPAALFGILVSTLLGAAFHLWKDGGLGRLFLYLILAWIGFWIGHFFGDAMGWTFGSIGPLRFGTAFVMALITIGLGYWLSQINRDERR